MTRVCSSLLLTGALCVLLITCFAVAAEPPVRATEAPNAAGIYWQAFSAMPTLKDDQRKVLETATGSMTAPLSDELKPIVAQYRVSLHEMHRAAAVNVCDWQLDIEAGPELLLPHLQKARELSRVALLRARQRFAMGDHEAALRDVLAVMKMGRDCGASPILISYLVNVAIEKMAIEVLAFHLPQLTNEQLDHVARSLSQLPATCSVAMAIEWEERLFGDWLDRKVESEAAKLNDPQAGGKLLKTIGQATGLDADFNPKADDTDGQRKVELLSAFTVDDVRTSMKRMRADYATLAKIAALSFDERQERMKSFEAELASSRLPKTREDALRYFSVSLLPVAKQVLGREEQATVRWQLLEHAIRVQRHGVEALQPIRTKKLQHHKTNTGFELRYPTSLGDEVLVIERNAGVGSTKFRN